MMEMIERQLSCNLVSCVVLADPTKSSLFIIVDKFWFSLIFLILIFQINDCSGSFTCRGDGAQNQPFFLQNFMLLFLN